MPLGDDKGRTEKKQVALVFSWQEGQAEGMRAAPQPGHLRPPGNTVGLLECTEAPGQIIYLTLCGLLLLFFFKFNSNLREERSVMDVYPISYK